MTYRSIFILLCLIYFPIEGESVEPQNRDYVLDLEDGQHVFVMIVDEDDVWYRFQSRNEEIRAKYGTSGLYKTFPTQELLWSVDWYTSRYRLFFSKQGKYLVRLRRPRLPLEEFEDDVAIEFYENGLSLHRYTLSDLGVQSDDVRISRITYLPQWMSYIDFNRENEYFYLATESGTAHLFNITDGEMFSDSFLKAKYFILQHSRSAKVYYRRNSRKVLGTCLSLIILITISVWYFRRRL